MGGGAPGTGSFVPGGGGASGTCRIPSGDPTGGGGIEPDGQDCIDSVTLLSDLDLPLILVVYFWPW